jgi:hypothetical protein
MIKNNLQQYDPYYFIPTLNARIIGILHLLVHLTFKQQTLVRYSINAIFFAVAGWYKYLNTSNYKTTEKTVIFSIIRSAVYNDKEL